MAYCQKYLVIYLAKAYTALLASEFTKSRRGLVLEEWTDHELFGWGARVSVPPLSELR